MPRDRDAAPARPGVGVLVVLAGLVVVLLAVAAWVTGVVGGDDGVEAAGDASASSVDPCGDGGNPVSCENAKPGSPPSEWDVEGAGDPTIQGFATDISTDLGGTVELKVDTDAAAYHVDIYRLGYYAGLGARRIATVEPSATLPQRQPSCVTDAVNGLVDCGTWGVSASWQVPESAVSGVYVARLVRDDTGGASHVPFVVRDDASRSALLVQTADTTWQAHNDYGGSSLYTGAPAGRAYAVSYNRPLVNRRGDLARTGPFSTEYPLLRWLEAGGYDVSYTTGVDTDRRGDLLLQHQTFVSAGHDEYWSAQQRAAVEAARVAGVNLAFLGGSASFWKHRWEPSIDGTATEDRTLVSYRETLADSEIDPDRSEDGVWTGTWRDGRYSPPADGGRPENALRGSLVMVDCCRSDALTVTAQEGRSRFWRDTSFARLAPGATGATVSGVLGWTWDEDLDNGSRPPGLVRLSTTTLDVDARLVDEGGSYRPGPATHHLVLYRASSGALVFSTGSDQWSWGLDTTHDNPGSEAVAADPDVAQATVNLLADMGSQPVTLRPGLRRATQSTDTTAPTSQLVSSVAGTTVVAGEPVTLEVTATDDVGQVGGVEVSTDDGASWHPADGGTDAGTRWTYAWTPDVAGRAVVRTRAVDDSGNLESPATGVAVTVAPRTCPCTILGQSEPPVDAVSDGSPTELGAKLRTDVDGEVTAIRFWKGAGNTGVHTGSLWSPAGRRLARVTFTGETASGWQTAVLPQPVPVRAGTTYLVSYFAPRGHWSTNVGELVREGVDAPPLRLLADGEDGPNGMFRADGTSGLPDSSFKSTNFYVDVVFDRGP